MNRSKGFLITSSIAGVFILVYGTYFNPTSFVGNYLLVGGLMDPNYLVLGFIMFSSVYYVFL